MKKNIHTNLLFLMSLLLSACGGSAISTAVTVVDPVITLKTYNDGSGVLAAYYDLGVSGGPSNITIASDDLASAREVLKGTLDLSVNSSATSGNYYVISRSGTSSSGASILLVSGGENLNASGSEYASMSLIKIGSEYGITTSGSKVNGMPTGSYTYTGAASVLSLGGATTGIGDGTFTMAANFDNNTASVAATIPSNSPAGSFNPAYFFASNSIIINQTDGSFSTSNATIGETDVSSNSASIKGYFAGTNAKGVHGQVFSNSSTMNWLGSFYGSR